MALRVITSISDLELQILILCPCGFQPKTTFFSQTLQASLYHIAIAMTKAVESYIQ